MFKTYARIVLALGVVAVAACNIDVGQRGRAERETRSVDLDTKAEKVRVEVTMGAGQLEVHGGSRKMMDAEFTYNIPSWKPKVNYDSNGATGTLRIEQPSVSATAMDTDYRWDIRLNDAVAMDMTFHLGAGQAKLDLGTLALRSVEVKMGVGQLNLDLRGAPKKDYAVQVEGGVGEANIYLPREVGIDADVTGGIGGINAKGLRQDGRHYVNDALESAKVRVRLTVHGGVGSVNLIAD